MNTETKPQAGNVNEARGQAGLPASGGSTRVSEQTLAIFDAVRKEGGEAWQRLRDKAQGEHMSLTAVIKCWGDPRMWGKA